MHFHSRAIEDMGDLHFAKLPMISKMPTNIHLPEEKDEKVGTILSEDDDDDMVKSAQVIPQLPPMLVETCGKCKRSSKVVVAMQFFGQELITF